MARHQPHAGTARRNPRRLVLLDVRLAPVDGRSSRTASTHRAGRTRSSRPAGRRGARTRSRRASSPARCRSSARARPPGARSGRRAPPTRGGCCPSSQPSSSATAGSDTSRLRGVKIGWPTNDQSHIRATGTTSHDSASTGPHRGRRTILAAANSSSPTVRIASGVATATGRKFGSKPAEVERLDDLPLDLEVRARDPEQLARAAAQARARPAGSSTPRTPRAPTRRGARPCRRHASATQLRGQREDRDVARVHRQRGEDDVRDPRPSPARSVDERRRTRRTTPPRAPPSPRTRARPDPRTPAACSPRSAAPRRAPRGGRTGAGRAG